MFEVPITVVRPEPLKSEPRPHIEHKDILFAPGDIKRHFIKPPEGSTWAVVRVVSQEKAATGKFVLHTVQLSPGKSVMNNNHEKMFSLSDLGEWSYGLAVQGRIGISFPKLLKFSFSEKATKICAICLMVLLSKRQNHKADCANFGGLLRKAELYKKILHD